MNHSASLSLSPSSMIQAHDAHPVGVATRLGDFREAQLRARMQLVPNEGTSHMRTNKLPGSQPRRLQGRRPP